MPPRARKSKKIYSGPTDLRDRRVTVYTSRRMFAEFEMHRRGIAKIAVGEDLKAAVRSLVVQKAMPYAIRIAPRGKTLEYVSSFRAVDSFEVIAGMRRVACRLYNSAPHAAAVEWVSKRGFGHGRHVLGRTLAHLNSTSPIGLEQAARTAKRKPWDAGLHPRGPRGRFAARAKNAIAANQANRPAATQPRTSAEAAEWQRRFNEAKNRIIEAARRRR